MIAINFFSFPDHLEFRLARCSWFLRLSWAAIVSLFWIFILAFLASSISLKYFLKLFLLFARFHMSALMPASEWTMIVIFKLLKNLESRYFQYAADSPNLNDKRKLKIFYILLILRQVFESLDSYTIHSILRLDLSVIV